jgi:hypothetical protein
MEERIAGSTNEPLEGISIRVHIRSDITRSQVMETSIVGDVEKGRQYKGVHLLRIDDTRLLKVENYYKRQERRCVERRERR